MSTSSRGESFYDTLVDIGYPGVDKLTPGSLDWLFECDGALPFLDWVSRHLTRENLVQVADMEDFKQLEINRPDKLLSGDLLEAALQCAGIGEEQLGCEELEGQIKELE